MRLARPGCLRGAEAAERVRRHVVGVDGDAADAQIRDAIGAGEPVAATFENVVAGGGVDAGVENDLGVAREDLAFARDRRSQCDLRRVPRECAEGLLHAQLEANRSSGHPGEHRCDRCDRDVLLAAEASADVRGDHAYVAEWEPEEPCDPASQLEWELVGDVQHDGCAVGRGDHRGVLHRVVGGRRRAVDAVDHAGSGGQSGIDVVSLEVVLLHDVAPRLAANLWPAERAVSGWARMENDGACEGLMDVENGLQLLDVDSDFVDGGRGGPGGSCGDGDQRLTVVAHTLAC